MGASFNELINGKVPVLVDLYATWCAPCKAQTPILEELAGRIGDSAKIIKVDVDKNPQLAMKYDVKGVPTLMIFQQGKVLWKGSGVRSLEELEQRLKAAAGA